MKKKKSVKKSVKKELSIEQRTTAIAKVMAKEKGLPVSMWELVLGDAYNLVYFGDPKELERIEKKIKK